MHHERLRLRHRLVKSLATAQDPNNYDPYETPEDRITVTSVLEKATRRDPAVTMSWQNYPVARSRAGRPPAEQQRRLVGGVVPAARGALSPVDCFSLFLTDEMLQEVVGLTNGFINSLMESMSEEQLLLFTLGRKDGGRDSGYLEHTDLTEVKARGVQML